MTTLTAPVPSPSPGSCPCCSEKSPSQCCDPVISGKRKAQTAEELLRARYTAFATGKIDYILDSHHSETRDQVNRQEIADWSAKSKWHGLKVLKVENGLAKDEEGAIVFHARYQPEGEEKIADHYEYSQFKKEKGEWKFFDAQGLKQGPIVRTEPKVGRNDPCTCGSGKKYKKCHGTAA